MTNKNKHSLIQLNSQKFASYYQGWTKQYELCVQVRNK